MTNREFLVEWLLQLFDGYGQDLYEFREAYDFDGHEYMYLAFDNRAYFDSFVDSIHHPREDLYVDSRNVKDAVLDIGYADMLILFEDI